MESPGDVVTVTDHAVVRWLERVLGVDVDQLRREMVPPELALLVREYGSGRFTIAGVRYIVSGGHVTTVHKHAQPQEEEP